MELFDLCKQHRGLRSDVLCPYRQLTGGLCRKRGDFNRRQVVRPRYMAGKILGKKG